MLPTKEIKTHVVKTFTGGHYHITAEQEIRLRSLSENQNIEIDGSIVKGKNIAEVVTTEKYYEQYPQKRPEHSNYTYNNFSERDTYRGYTKKHLDSKERLEKAIKIWKRQRDNGEVEIQTGGLQRLIDWAEEKMECRGK
jgi:hypothetical protein